MIAITEKHHCCKCGTELKVTHWSRTNTCPDGSISLHCTNQECDAYYIFLGLSDLHEQTSEYLDLLREERAAWAERAKLGHLTERLMNARVALGEYYNNRKKSRELSSPISELV